MLNKTIFCLLFCMHFAGTLLYTHAINQLLARNERIIAQQKRFVADAAHELKTPISALNLQIQRFRHLELPEPAASYLHVVEQGVQRSKHLLEQLLTLARSQHHDHKTPPATAIHEVIYQTLETLLPLALEKNIDIGLASEIPEIRLAIEPTDLYLILKNIGENAIRYSPAGSQVDYRLQQIASHVIIMVEDNGDGIPQEERELVVQAFYRRVDNDIEGTGLGLAIVNNLCQQYGAELHLNDAQHYAHGLQVAIHFPRSMVSA